MTVETTSTLLITGNVIVNLPGGTHGLGVRGIKIFAWLSSTFLTQMREINLNLRNDPAGMI